MTLILQIMHFVHHKLLYQELGQNVLTITHRNIEGETYIQNQHLFMDRFRN